MRLDIVILPPTDLSERIGKFVSDVHKMYPLRVAVDNKKLLPHISLLHLEARKQDIPMVVKEIEKQAKKHKKIKLFFSGFVMGGKFFTNGIKSNPGLYKLHKDVVETISPLRSAKTHMPSGKKNALQSSYMNKYGVANILKFFEPHITLGWVRNPKHNISIKRKLGKANFEDFVAQRLAVTEVNEYHQVLKVIKEFRLKN